MNKKLEIIKLYYEESRKIIDIVNEVQVSRAYISKIIKEDKRYQEKKKREKEETKKRKREYTKNKMRQVREEKFLEESFIRQQHIQASRELSSGYNNISNRALLKWNSSAYRYNQRIGCYEFDRKLVKSYAVPKYIRLGSCKK